MSEEALRAAGAASNTVARTNMKRVRTRGIETSNRVAGLMPCFLSRGACLAKVSVSDSAQICLSCARLYAKTVALVIASQLRKELSGRELFAGVSFKVERRDRIALSGPNGAGKTTLLRILNGETDYQGGKLVFSKGTRVALHDQRPPLDQGLTLRE